MTATHTDDITPPRPLSRRLSIDLDRKLNAIATDQVFLGVEADG